MPSRILAFHVRARAPSPRPPRRPTRRPVLAGAALVAARVLTRAVPSWGGPAAPAMTAGVLVNLVTEELRWARALAVHLDPGR